MKATQSRVRIPTRGLAIASGVITVIAATLMTAWWMLDRSQTFQHKADEHAQEAAIHEANRASTVPPWSDDEARKADYHARMNRKWEYASTHPWISPEADPPPPR